jgi:phage terminase large subunit GpA-like protein
MSFTDNNLYISQLEAIIRAGNVQISNIKPSDWVEQNVIMGQPFPGPYRYSKTPYCREIIDCLAPDHPARWVAFMKGLQVGASSGIIIPGLGWIIKESPANTYFTVGSPDLIEKANGKLDLLIKNSGLQDYIRPQVEKRRNSATGDKIAKKDFSGGFINITTPNNHKEWRDVSLKYGFIDDFEAAKSKSKESGATRKLIEGRFAAYADVHKIFYISTPELKATSNIEPAYLLGDQRKYLIPCPHCHEHIELHWRIQVDEKNYGGIYWEEDNGRLIESSVGYICQKCAAFFKDNNKQQQLIDGFWRPTAQASKPGFYSYHLSSLYAPPGMYSWKHYVQNWIECHPPGQPRNEAEYMTFVQTCLGQTYEPESRDMKANKIMDNARGYEAGTIPEALSREHGNGDIILLTCAADLNGTMRGVNGAEISDARLDYEIVAHSESGATYSILQGSIGTFIPRENTLKGPKADRKRWVYEHNHENSVWPEFEKILGRDFMTDTGRRMQIHLTGIDCGVYASTGAYPFIDKTNFNVVGVKGDREDKYLLATKDTKIFKESVERGRLFILQVGIIKDRISDFMNLKWERGSGDQPSNFMNYPNPSKEMYQYESFFKHYEAEHRTTVQNADGETLFRWVKKTQTAQNHMFDCRVYNLAIRDIYVFYFIKSANPKLREAFKGKDFTWRDLVAYYRSVKSA